MIEVKTSELVGPALDWAVFCAVYKGMQPEIHVIESVTVDRKPFIKPLEFPRAVSLSYSGAYGIECRWSPSGDWEHGGPLIDKYLIDLTVEHPSMICAALCDENGRYIDDKVSFGSTHLIAACRAIVAARLGDTVQIPDELAERAGQ